MKLVDCKECGEQVSAHAKTCPCCGVAAPGYDGEPCPKCGSVDIQEIGVLPRAVMSIFATIGVAGCGAIFLPLLFFAPFMLVVAFLPLRRCKSCDKVWTGGGLKV